VRVRYGYDETGAAVYSQIAGHCCGIFFDASTIERLVHVTNELKNRITVNISTDTVSSEVFALNESSRSIRP
jgi:hypothetical protein